MVNKDDEEDQVPGKGKGRAPVPVEVDARSVHSANEPPAGEADKPSYSLIVWDAEHDDAELPEANAKLLKLYGAQNNGQASAINEEVVDKAVPEIAKASPAKVSWFLIYHCSI